MCKKKVHPKIHLWMLGVTVIFHGGGGAPPKDGKSNPLKCRVVNCTFNITLKHCGIFENIPVWILKSESITYYHSSNSPKTHPMHGYLFPNFKTRHTTYYSRAQVHPKYT